MDDMAGGSELDYLRSSIRRFLEREVVPHRDRWRREGCVDRAVWSAAGAAGLLCLAIPEQYGGGGGTFRHEAVLIEELARIGFGDLALSLHNAIVAPYILHYGTEAQRLHYLPAMARGDMVGAIAMTEPGAGSDLKSMRTTARRDGNGWTLRGQKTFISNGQLADLVIVAAKTDAEAGARGVSLFIVEAAKAQGFRRGRNLEKIGRHAQDTSELFFDDVKLPADALLGAEGRGFHQLMSQLPQERLVIGVGSVAAMETAIAETLRYVRERQAFGQSLFDFQNTRFVLAEAKTQATIGRVFMDWCVERLVAGELDAATAAMSKWWGSQTLCEIADRCLQLFGGYGYMAEYPIAHLWADARIGMIYGGSNEIMKELIARSL
ncbi:acyl-CoA dehydrogenase family protein [Acidisphaera rubrifaciens]|uniref:Acyl-CoA dehydrogenase n=1 Tax=Acidisphaera rubrifaciens HS-AP3 TaxID=1231350 RepID=A0A0D6P8A8_9PROT|nr:acyl-CoA dehydrogenase family protein [Acidisphaera rubrifaciens]GAN78005.1 acyl-CoA dehydrogenase [Acidisphaera rubrifaciens HS-AP3]